MVGQGHHVSSMMRVFYLYAIKKIGLILHAIKKKFERTLFFFYPYAIPSPSCLFSTVLEHWQVGSSLEMTISSLVSFSKLWDPLVSLISFLPRTSLSTSRAAVAGGRRAAIVKLGVDSITIFCSAISLIRSQFCSIVVQFSRSNFSCPNFCPICFSKNNSHKRMWIPGGGGRQLTRAPWW